MRLLANRDTPETEISIFTTPFIIIKLLINNKLLYYRQFNFTLELTNVTTLL